jgi:glycosyltransferase involved in cell wall biosynthesis
VSATTIAFDARYVNDQYHGIGRHAYNLIESVTRLDEARHYLVYYHPGYTNTRFDLVGLRDRPNVTLHPVALDLYSPIEQLLWPAFLARDRADFFHSPYVPIPLLARVPSAITVHDLIFEHFPDYMPRRHLRVAYRLATRLGTLRASLVLTASESTRQDLQDYYGVPARKIHIIGNATDPTLRQEEDPDRLAAVRRRYGLPPRFLLTLGAGRPHKNVETAVEALAQLDAAVAPALVVAGATDARFEDGVAARARALRVEDRVVRPGVIREEDLAALYSLADVLVFPSLVEGFGLPIVEAMACGTPVVASDASSVPEVVGDAGLTFPPLDAGALTQALRCLLGDPALRADLVRRGHERAAYFSSDRVGKATIAAYDAALGTGGAVTPGGSAPLRSAGR